MNIKPTQDRVAIRPESVEQKSDGGILLPGNEKEKKNTGVVVAVGPGKFADNGKLIPMGIKVGDKVVFCDQYEMDGIEAKFGDVVLVEECDIRAIIG